MAIHFMAFPLETNIASATHLAATLAPGRGWAWAAAGAIIVEPLHLVPPGRRKLGMTDAAPAVEGKLDGL